MSHSKERHEKICLNCNAELTGRYCHVCGQENIEPKETVWGLVSHFFYDITHFDGKFFITTHHLVTKPGFLPKEYIRGRRASYLHPIRMYVFSSALFFLIFFAMFFKPKKWVNVNSTSTPDKVDSVKQLDEVQKAVLQGAGSKEDSLALTGTFDKVRNKIIAAQVEDRRNAAEKQAKKDSVAQSKPKRKRRTAWFEASSEYKSVEEYDSVQKTLPRGEQDGWWARKAAHRTIIVNNKYEEEGPQKFWEELVEKFVHSIPYILFVSLPFYALYLKLLYFRKKQFYYVDHGIFLIYLYIFTFIFMLIYFSVQKTHDAMHWSWMGWIEGILLIAGIFYTYKAMRNFYGQSRAMTILKFCLLNFMAIITVAFLFMIFFTLTLVRI